MCSLREAGQPREPAGGGRSARYHRGPGGGPKSSRIDIDTFINTLMAQTSLEGNVSMNLVMMGLDNRPAQKNLKTIL